MSKTRPLTSSVLRIATIVTALAGFARLSAGEPPSAEKERELIAILRSDKPEAEKALACKNLAVHGSSDAVPELAKLLSSERLASWARIPLEVIPGPEADGALRAALGSVEGKLLVGVINSIGVRRDVKAVEPLVVRLQDRDVDVASAAAVALGNIGNEAAANSLRDSLAASPVQVRSAVAEGLVLSAERLLSDGDSGKATEIYDLVREADVPRQRILEATRGAILARKQDGIALLLEQLRSSDKGLFQVALMTAREFPGEEVDKALADELPRATPDRAALVISAMADRKETVVLPAILKAAGDGPKQVRIAAIGALGRVGDATALSPLLAVAVESDEELAQTAKTALADLPGDDVNNEIVTRLASAEGKPYPLLLELVGLRRIPAVQALVKALDHSDKSVRTVALASLGTTVPANDLSVLIAQVISPKHAEDAEAAQRALKTASVRMPDRDSCAAELAAAIERAPGPIKIELLEILSEVGGTKALAAVGAAAKGSDPELQDAGSRILGKWVTVDAAPVLLDLAKTGPAKKFQTRAIRGYIGVARRFARTMPEEQRNEMCQTAYDISSQPAEKKLVVEMLKLNPSMESLKLAIKAMSEVPDLKDEATTSILAIVPKLGDKAKEVQEILRKVELQKSKVEIVKAEYGSGSTQKDVTAIVQKQLADLPLIFLSAASYNESFGGDPAPGTTKQLKISYKLDGKTGEATFAENALIVLPRPK